jgi:hypothetical protein
MNKIFKHVRKDVKKILGRMINTTPSKLKWIGTQAKLIEIVYMLWLTELIVNERGKKATLKEITELIFTVLNKKVPQNPTKVINSLRNRKEPEKTSILIKVLQHLYHMFLHM